MSTRLNITPPPMTRAETAATSAAFVKHANARAAVDVDVREAATWGANDARHAIRELAVPTIRDRTKSARLDLEDLATELEGFRRGTLVAAQETKPVGPNPTTGHPGGQRIVSEALFFEVKGTRYTVAEAAEKVRLLVAEVRLIGSDNKVNFRPH